MGEYHHSPLQDALPTLPWLTPGTEEYNKRRVTYNAANPAVPQAILCPRSAEEVAAIVRLAREHNIPFSVRSGGHDVHGRSVVHDALCIDMRDINFVEVAPDRKTAVIGGGVLFEKLSKTLHSHGLATPSGSVPDVGYVGWSTLGGYNCLSTNFGLGVDQIVEAEVANHKGELVNADEEMLQGIRGAGGNFGVITSLRIKVYEVKMLLAGLLVFDTSAQGIFETFKAVTLSIQDLEAQGKISRNIVLQPLVLNNPEAGRSFGVTYVWSSNDHDAGRQALDEMVAQIPATVAMNTVNPITPPDWSYMIGSFIAKNAWGGPNAISFGKLSSKTLDIIGESLQEMPSDPGTCFCLHMLASQSPSVTDPALANASCFSPEARQSHTMIEIVGSSISEASMERCEQWGKRMRERLFASGEAMQGSYISVVGPETLTLEDIYGEKLPLLKSLKQKYDPDGVFRNALPRMLD